MNALRRIVRTHRLAAACLATFVLASAGTAAFDLSWFTIDGGGAMSAPDGSLSLSGTVGQPDAGEVALTGGNLTLVGGFWPYAERSCRIDLDGDGDVDGFDFLTFANCYNGSDRTPLAACLNPHADIDGDDDVDGFDFLTFANCYNGSDRAPLAACPCFQGL